MLENLNLTIEDLKHPHILRVLFFNETTETVDIFKLSNYIEAFILEKKDRKENGVYFTPKILVDLLMTTVDLPMVSDLRIIDTSVGIGNLIIPFARNYASHRMAYSTKQKKKNRNYKYFLGDTYKKCMFGIDINQDFIDILIAVMSLDTGLPKSEFSSNFICGDFFQISASFPKKFDVLLANPPYITGIKSEVQSDLKGVTNISFDYLNKSMDLLKPSHQISLVMPSIFLSAKTYNHQRSEWMANRNVNKVWLCSPDLKAFKDASINVCVVSLNTNINLMPQFLYFPPNGRSGTVAKSNVADWSTIYYQGSLLQGRKLKEDFTVHAGLVVSDAYLCLDYIEDGLEIEGKKFVTSGMIDTFECLWGEKPKSILKKSFQYPRLSVNNKFPVGLNEKIRSTRPKIIVSGLVMRMKTFVDSSGEYISGAGTYNIYHKTDSLEELKKLCEYLNTSDDVHTYFTSVLETKRIGQGGYPISKTFLEGIPLYV